MEPHNNLPEENILLVESANDKAFIERLIAFINAQNIAVSDAMTCSAVHTYECMGGADPEKLKLALSAQKAKADRGAIKRIGILIGLDQYSVSERLHFVNTALQRAFQFSENPILNKTNQLFLYKISHLTSIEVACFFTNYNGSGELETVLKAIAKQSSTHADCLKSWQDCLQTKGIDFKTKYFDKLWIDFYYRWDNCSKDERYQAERKCNLESSLSKDLWNFEHPCLDELKDFLRLFND